MKSSIASLLIALTSATTSAYGLELEFQRRSVSVESQSTDNRFDLVKTLGGKDATLSSTSNVTNVQNTRVSMALISFRLFSETSLVYDEHCVKWETWVSSWYIELEPHRRSLEVLVALDTGSTDLWYDPLLLLTLLPSQSIVSRVAPTVDIGTFNDSGIPLELLYGDGSYGVSGTIGVAPFKLGTYDVPQQGTLFIPDLGR